MSAGKQERWPPADLAMQLIECVPNNVILFRPENGHVRFRAMMAWFVAHAANEPKVQP